ncbi:hypothetical protein LARI1_G006639 [Lachnellula arida]|uniref:Uncharacterized protein n=1 Tax=Lachnellula arida TaxID=1316785 RepID=A0A8T9BAS5_9HELO|nr:hypothetical protein LARI1_G006639 [Lachnellula arida]
MSHSYLQPSSNSPSRLHRPQLQTQNYTQRSSMSSASSTSSSSSASSSYSNDASQRYSMDCSAPRVETLRCSRCAKCVETVATARGGHGDLGRVSTDDASASGMVRFGHNLYYCDRCARMVGYT